MATRRVVVGSKVGLHARPAALFVQAVNRQPVKVTIAKEGKEPVRAGSILMVLALDVRGARGNHSQRLGRRGRAGAGQARRSCRATSTHPAMIDQPQDTEASLSASASSKAAAILRQAERAEVSNASVEVQAATPVRSKSATVIESAEGRR